MIGLHALIVLPMLLTSRLTSTLSLRNPWFQTIAHHLALFTISSSAPITLVYTNEEYLKVYAQLWQSLKARKFLLDFSKSFTRTSASINNSEHMSEKTDNDQIANVNLKQERKKLLQPLRKVQNDVRTVVDNFGNRTVETEMSQNRMLMRSVRRQAKLKLHNNLRVLSSIRSEAESYSSHTQYPAYEKRPSTALQDDEHLGVVIAGDTSSRAPEISPLNGYPDVQMTGAIQENHSRLMEKVISVSQHSVKLTASVARLLESINRLYPKPGTHRLPAQHKT